MAFNSFTPLLSQQAASSWQSLTVGLYYTVSASRKAAAPAGGEDKTHQFTGGQWGRDAGTDEGVPPRLRVGETRSGAGAVTCCHTRVRTNRRQTAGDATTRHVRKSWW